MNRSQVLENVASAIAGITTGAAFVLLYVLLTAPVAETLEKLLS